MRKILLLAALMVLTVVLLSEPAEAKKKHRRHLSPLPPAACADRIDNDRDGLIDYPNDPGCSSSTDTAETDPASMAPPETDSAPPPSSGNGASLGVFPGNTYGNPAWDTNMQALRDFESLTASKPKYVNLFHAWAGKGSYLGLPSAVSTYVRNGYIPVITWEADDYATGKCYLPRDIAAGNYDAYVVKYAQQVAAVPGEVGIRLFHEMNGPWQCWGLGNSNNNTGQDLIDAWRHVHDVFAQQGVTNVRWVWEPNIRCPNYCAPYPFSGFYPGDAYVDWLSLDGFNWGDVHNDPWYDFYQLYQPGYDEITALNPDKPLMIAEYASDERGGSKADFIKSIVPTLQANFPRIKVLMWFHSNQDGGLFRVDSSQSSLDAYRAFVADPYFG